MTDSSGNPRKLNVDFALMGTLHHSALSALHDSSVTHLKDQGWLVDWYVDVRSLVQMQDRHRSAIPAHEFYERTYEVVDVALLQMERLSGAQPPAPVSIYIQDSLLPSYQLRSRLNCQFSAPHQYGEVWSLIRTTNQLLRNLAEEIGLTPSTETWTMRLADTKEPGSARPEFPMLDDPPRLLKALLGDSAVTVESASRVGHRLVFKFLSGTSEQYLILSSGVDDDLAISRLYYLTIAKAALVSLCDELKRDYLANVAALPQQTTQYRLATRIRLCDVDRLYGLRTSIAERADSFRNTRTYVDLASSFVAFHVDAFLRGTAEVRALPDTPGVLENETAQLNLFYVRPLDSLVRRIDDTIKEALDLVVGAIQLFTVNLNLRSQVLIERLQALTVMIALGSLVFAIVSLVK